MWAPGRHVGAPLLTVRELLEDLAAEEEAVRKDMYGHDGRTEGVREGLPPTGEASLRSGAGRGEGGALVDGRQNLQTHFERTFTQLNVALAHSGHSWPALTQQLCRALSKTELLVTEAKSRFSVLTEQINGVLRMMQRNLSNVRRLHAATREKEASFGGPRFEV